MKRRLFYMVAMIWLCFIFAGCHNEEVSQPSDDSANNTETNTEKDDANESVVVQDEEIALLQAKIMELKQLNESLNEEKESLVQVIKNIFARLSEEEKLAFSREQFVYELTVNEEPVPKDGKMSVSPEALLILLSQRNNGIKFLESEWIEKGAIRGASIYHIVDLEPANWDEAVGGDGTIVTSRGYRFSNAEVGTIITFQITDE